MCSLAGRIEHEREAEVETAANLCRQLGYENKDHLMAGLIIGGYDERVRF